MLLQELETELLAPHSTLIPNVCVALLKMVSSHRGLVPDQFEDYTRRQYRVRKPDANPFGEAPEPVRFAELELATKVRVLHQLSVWAFQNPDRIREKMKNADEKEQLSWVCFMPAESSKGFTDGWQRMEPCGFDQKGNTYYILDDNRLYRRTPWISNPDDTAPPKKVKGASKRKAPKRRRVSTALDEEEGKQAEEQPLGVWSCVCVTPDDWNSFLCGFEDSKDPDEKALRGYLKDEVLPELTRGWVERQKERLLLDAVANRKRSSRLDEKIAKQKAEEEKAAAVRKQQDMVKAARSGQLEVEKHEKVMATRLPHVGGLVLTGARAGT